VQNTISKPPLSPPPPPPQLSFHPFYAQNSFQDGYQNGMTSQILPNQQIHPNPFSKSNTNFKPLQPSWPQPSHIFQKDSIPNTMESFQQPELKAEEYVDQPTQKLNPEGWPNKENNTLRRKNYTNATIITSGLPASTVQNNTVYTILAFMQTRITLLQKNKSALQTVPSQLWLQPKNLPFHNLCKQQKLPIGKRNF
jgi:hypothetical protein